MKHELKEEIIARYPLLFKEGYARSGFEVGEGWVPLIDGLCTIIEWHLKTFVPEELRGGVYVAQIKEKFGSLRFYMNQSVFFIDGAIAMAEHMSYRICEDCG